MSDNKFSVGDIARIHGLKIIGKESLKRTYCVCPFCGKPGKQFSYVVDNGKRQNIWGCFSCGQKGSDAISLHIALSEPNKYLHKGEINYKQAYKDVYRAIENDATLESARNSERNAMENCIKDVEMADPGVVHKTYTALLHRLKLKKEHFNNLKKRGLSDNDIYSFGFRSTTENASKVCDTLLEDGYTLEGVPGFYPWTTKWDIHPFYTCHGYLCPVVDGMKKVIRGFQIRLDKPINDGEDGKNGEEQKGSKYVWVSSGSKGGCSSGAICSFLPGTNGNNAVIVVEGILKAIIVYCLLGKRISVIGFPGVNCQEDLSRYLEYLQDSVVFLAFDMDRLTPITEDSPELLVKKVNNLQKCCKEMSDFFVNNGILSHELTWDYNEKGEWKENFKGLDDFLKDYNNKDLFVRYILSTTDDMLSMRHFLES